MSNLREMEMAFPASLIKEMRKSIWHCEVCHDYSEYLEGHSSSGLHITAQKDEEGFLSYRVYDACNGHSSLTRRNHISQEMAEHFIFMDDRLSDCILCCPVCHDELKRIALEQARLEDPNFKGRVPPPEIMYRVTRDMVARGKRLVYEVNE